MKKAIALLVAITTALSLGVFAYADGGIGTTPDPAAAPNLTPFSLGLESVQEGTGYVDYLTLEAGDMFLVWTEGDLKGDTLTPNTVLTPGNQYTFEVWYAGQAVTTTEKATGTDLKTKANGTRVLKGDLAGARLRVRTRGASGMLNAVLKERGSGNNARYELEVTAREQYGTKLSDVELEIAVSGASATTKVKTSSTDLRVGFPTMSDDDIDSYAEDDIIVISNDAPVITSKQFQRLSKAYNYKPITFENEDATWSYTARVSGNGDVNFYNTEEVVEDIIMKLPDQEYKFINFRAGVKFATNGEMRIDVSDISPNFSRMYTYLYRNGVLTPVNTTYDSGNSELVFRTNYLGTFVITDTEITDTEILGQTEGPAVEPEPTTPPPTENGQNPNTGVDATMNLLATLGLAAIGGGSVIRKRK